MLRGPFCLLLASPKPFPTLSSETVVLKPVYCPGRLKALKNSNAEDRLHSFREHGNLFGEAQVFSVAGEFAYRKCSRRVAKGIAGRVGESSWIQSAALSAHPTTAVESIHLLSLKRSWDGRWRRDCRRRFRSSSFPHSQRGEFRSDRSARRQTASLPPSAFPMPPTLANCLPLPKGS
jgi:hypothetical protein